MALYALGDLHLHFGTDKVPRDQIKGRLWKDHETKFLRNCSGLITDEDTLVLIGDHSWGRNPEQCGQDFEYIRSLPGRKILIRGNHDMFWDVKKTGSLNSQYGPQLTFLQNNFATYGDYAIVGTKGFTFEGPFFLDRRGRIIGWDEEKEEHAKQLVSRELERLRMSFELAKQAGYGKYIMFLHYPPTSIIEDRSGFTDMAEEYGAEHVIYAHSHGESRFHDSIEGEMRGVKYSLASGDFLHWQPLKILN
ncbi:MAG: metallophosphoesterase [Oscillospiraceae bacterium]|nr:metallophosphoesterase [Oscillospiraceae bacterium]